MLVLNVMMNYLILCSLLKVLAVFEPAFDKRIIDNAGAHDTASSSANVETQVEVTLKKEFFQTKDGVQLIAGKNFDLDDLVLKSKYSKQTFAASTIFDTYAKKTVNMCKKALPYAKEFLLPDGTFHSGTNEDQLQHFVRQKMYEEERKAGSIANSKHDAESSGLEDEDISPESGSDNEDGSRIPPGWMFDGEVAFFMFACPHTCITGAPIEVMSVDAKKTKSRKDCKAEEEKEQKKKREAVGPRGVNVRHAAQVAFVAQKNSESQSKQYQFKLALAEKKAIRMNPEA